MADLLLELFCEEIPARMQKKAAEDLKKLVTNALVDNGLTYDAACEYYTPRRLTLDIRGLTPRSKDIDEEIKGPSVKAPEQAIQGFLRKSGLKSVDEAIIVNDPKKGDFYVAKITKKGKAAQEIIADIMPNIIQNFPWPKSMRWGKDSSNAKALRWIRPLQNILCVFGSDTGETEVIDFKIGGLKSNNLTYGHRFLSDGKAIKIRRFDDYISKLEAAKVILDAERRKNIILSDAKNLCFAKGLELVEDEALADEVAGLVEWPVVLMGQFEEDFLAIPPEIIQLTIRVNQKCFVTRKIGEDIKLSNHFILVSNIIAADDGVEIANGNGKVVRARLSDALYFWQTDQHDLPDLDKLQNSAKALGLDLTKPLDQRMARLDALNVTFHAKLGTQGARVARIEKLATMIAPLVDADIKMAKRASLLAKADLQTEAVGEFPELQGVMGHKYALLQGEDAHIAKAIEDHYRPQGPNDRIPQDSVAIAVALADKIDTLVGFWVIDEKPTGSKDPYALRRAALGVIRILMAKDWTIHLLPLFAQALNGYDAIKTDKTTISTELLAFFHDRLKVYLKDEGARHDAIDAVLKEDSDNLLEVARKVEALIAFINGDDGENLLAGTKRAVNILEAEEKKGHKIGDKVQEKLFKQVEENALFSALETSEKQATGFIKKGDFNGALKALAILRQPIDDFFSSVLVNDDDEKIRENRLALLKHMRLATQKVADFSKLAI